MDNNAYIDMLCERYTRYFDIKRDYALLGKNIDIFAEYNMKNQRFFLTKGAVIFSFENFEYCIVKAFDHRVDESEIEDFTEFLKEATNKLVKPNDEHMSTYVSGIIVSDKGFCAEAIKRAKKFKYSKNFMFTLKGWCDVRLLLVDLMENQIITNSKGREVKKNYIFD